MIELRIDELLDAKGKSAYWLAVTAEIPHSTVYKLRHQKTQGIQWDTLEKLCKALECAPGDLIVIADGKPEPKKKEKPKG